MTEVTSVVSVEADFQRAKAEEIQILMERRIMRRTAVKILSVALLFGLFAMVASATPTPCTNFLSQSVLNINAGGGCTIGGLLFNNFMVQAAGTSDGNAPTIAPQITLTNATLGSTAFPQLGASDIDLNFNPNLGGNTGGNITDLHFAFTVTGGFIGADLVNGGTGGTSIQEVICNSPTGINGGCLSANQIFANVINDGQAALCAGTVKTGTWLAQNNVCNVSLATEATGAIQAWVFKDISIASTSTSHLTSFDESFVTPEPASFILLGAGLLGIGLLRRKKA